MRRFLCALAVSVLPTVALAHGHGGGHAGHMGGGHWGGARVGGPVGGAMTARAAVPMSGQMGARVTTNMGGRWNGNWGSMHHGHHHHRHAKFFFAGGPVFAGYGYYDYSCWQWTATPWGPQRVWVCDSY